MVHVAVEARSRYVTLGQAKDGNANTSLGQDDEYQPNAAQRESDREPLKTLSVKRNESMAANRTFLNTHLEEITNTSDSDGMSEIGSNENTLGQDATDEYQPNVAQRESDHESMAANRTLNTHLEEITNTSDSDGMSDIERGLNEAWNIDSAYQK